jgi:repressor LexA
MNKLTDRQRMVLEYICSSISDRGYPPTLREIGLKLGIRSTNGVNDHLRALERKGYLTREDMKSRTLRPTDVTLRLVGAGSSALGGRGDLESRIVLDDDLGEAIDDDLIRPGSSLRGASTLRHAAQQAYAANDDMLEIPIVGRVAAGLPIEAIEQRVDTVRIDRMMLGRGGRGGDVFGLKVQGESMIEAGIFHNDYVFVRKQLEAPRGAIVIAMVGDEATCKYFYPESTHIRLEPANAAMAPILIPRTDWRDTQILGVVVGVFRAI